MAALALVLPRGKAALLPAVCISLEEGSTHSHRLSDRQTFTQLLAAVRPGDVVVFASPCRLARAPEELEAGLRALAARGAIVLVVAIGNRPASPLAVLALPDSLAGSSAQPAPAAERAEAVAALQQQVIKASRVSWAMAADQGKYSSQHGIMQRMQCALLPAGHCIRRVLAALCHGRAIVAFVRTSAVEVQGGAQACAGAADAGGYASRSLSRQHGTIAWALG